MNYLTRCFLLLLLLLPLAGNGQNTLSGVVNDYAAVTALDAADNELTLQDASVFSEGDRVLLIQMKGANIDQSNSASFGSIQAYNHAGHYELNRICKKDGNTLMLVQELLHNYDPADGLQLVRVPEPQQAVVIGALTGKAWDGSTGGIIALDVQGTLTLQADVLASGIGFRGGEEMNSTLNCSFAVPVGGYAYDPTSGFGAHKGEGIADVPIGSQGGRGALANGGGGGNDHNSGGGGGANATAGGRGGNNEDPGTFNCHGFYPGMGGRPLSYSGQRLFLGGGGGAGHANNNSTNSGGRGGGIVILIADSIIGNGHVIQTDGTKGGDAFGDGAGAGGAGGTIALSLREQSLAAANVQLRAVGGDGGDANSHNADRCFGPGGGGSGGVIVRVDDASNSNPLLLGGDAGEVINSTAACDGSSLGAEDGEPGTVLNVNALAENQRQSPSCCPGTPFFQTHYTICEGDFVHLQPNVQGDSYLWSTGDTTTSIVVTTSGTYWVTIKSGYCTYRDTVTVNVTLLPEIGFPDSVILCEGETVELSTNVQGAYTWSTGASSASILVGQPGTYWLEVVTPTCNVTDTIRVVERPKPMVNLGLDTSICSSAELVLEASQYGTWRWPDGSTGSTFTVNSAGTYWLEVTENGCTGRDEITVSEENCDLVIPNVITPNADGKNDRLVILNIETGVWDLTIYNRWGEAVYHSSDYNNTWSGDGLPEGSYFYILATPNGDEQHNGSITLLRQ